MTFVQYGLRQLARKIDRTIPNNYQRLTRALVVIAHDVKLHDVNPEFARQFVLDIGKSTRYLSQPDILMSLWRQYKKKGGME